MPVIAQTIVDRSRVVLQDPLKERWTDPVLFGWLQDGQVAAAVLSPGISNRTQAIPLLPGTRQVLPPGGTALLRVVRNMGANGDAPGPAVRPTTMASLDAVLPSWHTSAVSAVVKHWVQDPQDPRAFYVWPPSSGAFVEALYFTVPEPIASIGAAITIDDAYVPALIDYVLYRAYDQDHELAGNDARAAFHKAEFDRRFAPPG